MPKSTEELYRELMAKGDAAQQQANDILSQIDNRPAFQYNPNEDALWRSAQQQYMHSGRRAMEDTMGQAAGLTGGYGSTYSQSAGNQAYNEWLSKLNGQLGTYAQMARSNYDAEGDRMRDRYNIAMNLADKNYGQARDALGDLRYEQEWAQQQQQYADQMEYQDWQMSRANQSDAYSWAMQMLQTGQMPSAETLAAAGIDPTEAQSYAKYYANLMAMSSGGSGGSGYRYSGGDDEDKDKDKDKDKTPKAVKMVTDDEYKGIRQSLYELSKYSGQAAYNRAVEIMNSVDGRLTLAQNEDLAAWFKYLFLGDGTQQSKSNSTGTKTGSHPSTGGGKFVNTDAIH